MEPSQKDLSLWEWIYNTKLYIDHIFTSSREFNNFYTYKYILYFDEKFII